MQPESGSFRSGRRYDERAYPFSKEGLDRCARHAIALIDNFPKRSVPRTGTKQVSGRRALAELGAERMEQRKRKVYQRAAIAGIF